ncbi:hypothetical protein INR49_005080 [Caranx melampygus]|nr:hypothetical protein INR49_005080 [Caranx melampygus]
MSSACPRLLHAPRRKRVPLTLAVACANVYSGCIAMARRDAVVQPYQFDPEWDPEGEAPEERQALRLQQDVTEWLPDAYRRSMRRCHVRLTILAFGTWTLKRGTPSCAKEAAQSSRSGGGRWAAGGAVHLFPTTMAHQEDSSSSLPRMEEASGSMEDLSSALPQLDDDGCSSPSSSLLNIFDAEDFEDFALALHAAGAPQEEDDGAAAAPGAAGPPCWRGGQCRPVWLFWAPGHGFYFGQFFCPSLAGAQDVEALVCQAAVVVVAGVAAGAVVAAVVEAGEAAVEEEAATVGAEDVEEEAAVAPGSERSWCRAGAKGPRWVTAKPKRPAAGGVVAGWQDAVVPAAEPGPAEQALLPSPRP